MRYCEMMHSAQGIILRRGDFRERDERVVLYTREFGKISVIAKGVKRIEAKLRGNLDIFNVVDIAFVQGSHFFILTGVDLKERFLNIANSPATYNVALAAAKIVDNIFEENLPERQTSLRDDGFFDQILYVLKKLDEFAANTEDSRDLETHSWLLAKKLQMNVLNNQGFSSHPPVQTIKLSGNAVLLLKMLEGGNRKSVRLTKQDFMSIEDMFTRQFAYSFNFKSPSWIPRI